MKRWIEGMMVSVFAVVVLALAFPAWAQDVVTAAVPEASERRHHQKYTP